MSCTQNDVRLSAYSIVKYLCTTTHLTSYHAYLIANAKLIRGIKCIQIFHDIYESELVQ